MYSFFIFYVDTYIYIYILYNPIAGQKILFTPTKMPANTVPTLMAHALTHTYTYVITINEQMRCKSNVYICTICIHTYA